MKEHDEKLFKTRARNSGSTICVSKWDEAQPSNA